MSVYPSVRPSVRLSHAGIVSRRPHHIIWSWYIGRWWVGCYIWYSEEGTGWGRSQTRLRLCVPNETAHPPTASVPIIALPYIGPLLCGFNVPLWWLCHVIRLMNCRIIIKPPLATERAASCNGRVHLFVFLSVCLSVCLAVCRQNAKMRFSQKLSNLEL